MALEAAFASGQGQSAAQVDRVGFAGGLAEDLLLRCSKGQLVLRFPIDLQGRVGTRLDELRGTARLSLDGRVARAVRLEAFGGVEGTWRPAWPDVYQPVLDEALVPTGDLLGTDRQSFLVGYGGMAATFRLSRTISFVLEGRYALRDSADDPAYDDVVAPDHLTPFDRHEAAGTLRLRGRQGAYRHLTSVTVTRVGFARRFARDAVTGATHATGPASGVNPLETDLVSAVTTRHSGFLPALRLRLTGELGYAFVADLYAGYQSRHELRATFGVRLRPTAGLAISVTPFVAYTRYTDDGYGVGPTHPPLDDHAAVRTRFQLGGTAEVRVRLVHGRLVPFLRFDWSNSWTNYPDYAAWVHPRSSPYNVDFDSGRLAVLVGLESRF